MNPLIEVDAKKSREILKSIRYGMAIAVAEKSVETTFVSQRIARLKKEYLELRSKINEKSAPIGNVIFYTILKKRYADFHYEFDFQRGRFLSNLHCFKVNGKPPSLSTMLLNDDIGHLSEPERRYGVSIATGQYGRSIEALFKVASLVYPDHQTFLQFLSLLEESARTKNKICIVSALCPDYSYDAADDGTVRYTFEGLGSSPGLAGNKYLEIVPAIKAFFCRHQINHCFELFGGDFEYLSFSSDNSSFRIGRDEFIAKIKGQLAAVVRLVDAPIETHFFFEEINGEERWTERHQEIFACLLNGDYGKTGLATGDVHAIFQTRLPLYSAWFHKASPGELFCVFLKQAAEYALMGEIYSELFEHVVVIGVDHSKMAPFYSFSSAISVIYRKIDYIVEEPVTLEPREILPTGT